MHLLSRNKKIYIDINYRQNLFLYTIKSIRYFTLSPIRLDFRFYEEYISDILIPFYIFVIHEKLM